MKARHLLTAWLVAWALGVLIALALHAEPIPYDRTLYRHWIDADGDCQDTRQEVLIEESLKPAELDSTGCKVVAGLWHCAYTGRSFTSPAMLDIDHYIPLKEVHESGGDQWTAAQRCAYANDLRHPDTLIAVWRGANRSKGARDPPGWIPPNTPYRFRYLSTWLALKYYWGLTMDETERTFIASAFYLQLMGR